MRCSKSCYLCDLELIALFNVIEVVMFFRNDFLVDLTADFCFLVSAWFVQLSPVNDCTNTAAACSTFGLLPYIRLP